VREFGRFLVVGGTGFVVDGALLLLLVHGAGMSKLWARLPSFLVAVTVTWWLHRHFTFAWARSTKPSAREWLRFVSGNVVGNGLNLALYWFLVGEFGWGPLAALALASGVAVGVNYGVSATWVFRRR
jgi:putative flippase GtrA